MPEKANPYVQWVLGAGRAAEGAVDLEVLTIAPELTPERPWSWLLPQKASPSLFPPPTLQPLPPTGPSQGSLRSTPCCGSLARTWRGARLGPRCQPEGGL